MPVRTLFTLIACLALITVAARTAACAETPAPDPAAEHVTLTTSDQYHVAALYWAPKKPNAPGVILLHQRGSNKESWGDLGSKLVSEGYAAIAIDMRGHGQTKDPKGNSMSLASLKEIDYQYMLRDIEAAHNYLDEQADVDGNRIAIIGASIGANLAIMYASNDKRVRTVIALSPGLDYFGLKPMDYLGDYGKRALYLIAAKGDKYSDESCTALTAAASESDPVSYRPFDGKDHGTNLLKAHPGLDLTIIDGWLLNHLPPNR